ncbi:hypothetical protein Ancab_030566 [Ancistrocladus abbreviatus]
MQSWDSSGLYNESASKQFANGCSGPSHRSAQLVPAMEDEEESMNNNNSHTAAERSRRGCSRIASDQVKTLGGAGQYQKAERRKRGTESPTPRKKAKKKNGRGEKKASQGKRHER